jgi:hypothetical protein
VPMAGRAFSWKLNSLAGVPTPGRKDIDRQGAAAAKLWAQVPRKSMSGGNLCASSC